jgi:hypothetical protein
VRVTDFGLPEHYVGEPAKKNWYAAPEGGPSRAADLYGLGAVLYEMLWARTVSEGALDSLASAPPAGPLPPAFSAVLRRLLAPIGERYEDARDVVRDLNAVLNGETEPSAVPSAAEATVVEKRPGIGLGLLGLAGLVLVWFSEQPFVGRFISDLVALLLA